jgi:hypothetical protein
MAESDDVRSVPVRDGTLEPVGPGSPTTGRPTFDPTVIDFGHYAGRTVAELAGTDPDYLRWLERHPSGARYRAEIHRALGTTPISTDWRR